MGNKKTLYQIMKVNKSMKQMKKLKYENNISNISAFLFIFKGQLLQIQYRSINSLLILIEEESDTDDIDHFMKYLYETNYQC